jgi:hypothetical protein
MSSISSASSSTTKRRARQVERAAFEMVAQAAGRAHHDMRAVVELATFLRRVHPADAGGDAQPGFFIEPGEFAADLERQFARGSNGQRQRCTGRRHAIVQQIGGHGHAERNRLARSGLGGNQEIAANGLVLEHSGLDRSRLGIAAGGKGLGNGVGKQGKGHETQWVWAGLQRGKTGGGNCGSKGLMTMPWPHHAKPDIPSLSACPLAACSFPRHDQMRKIARNGAISSKMRLLRYDGKRRKRVPAPGIGENPVTPLRTSDQRRAARWG